VRCFRSRQVRTNVQHLSDGIDDAEHMSLLIGQMRSLGIYPLLFTSTNTEHSVPSTVLAVVVIQ
jgi:hypothetical protein